MILSMTGFGAATLEEGARRVTVEVRTVNHRYLKVTLKLPRDLAPLESELEALVRRRLRRGTVTLVLRYRDEEAEPPYWIDVSAALRYRRQIESLWAALGLREPAWHDSVEPLLGLPGVVRESGEETAPAVSEEAADLVRRTADQALEALERTRREEGRNLAEALRAHAGRLEGLLLRVGQRAPAIPREQRDRLQRRVRSLVAEVGPGVAVSEGDLVRELCLLADKTDVAEELDRLKSHLDRWRGILDEGGEAGRRLEFLLQEMLREANTIGSKAADPDVAHAVVEMKCEVERMKEQVLNLE